MSEYQIAQSPRLRTSNATFQIGARKPFTPSLTFSTPGNLSVTYVRQVGDSYRIGDLVFCNGYMTLSAFTHTTAADDLLITGFPYVAKPASSSGGLGSFGTLRFSGITKANYTQFVIEVSPDTTQAVVRCSGSGQTVSIVAASDMPTGGNVSFVFSITYLTNE